ncbi:dienelactone hydrolase family protein [Luteimicrobium xylanilyticum]|uniref:Carboxymethylenebutenolidase n=1 Tax=Luteimicrobium xylanilyticum TaxID=1133546 RepID=A0A5P9QFR9_9MICO|nr:dienelactone hydrolase family protein [Luteimicrobium xylanilyticum]QFU99932.1 Carboxymethylenebutenolidase [Luteimicrobium xylanilyticum]
MTDASGSKTSRFPTTAPATPFDPTAYPPAWHEVVGTVPERVGSRVVGGHVRYGHDAPDGTTPCEGYVAWDEALWDDPSGGPRPAVLLVHDWLGVGPTVRARAHMLARLGYVAFAADVYGLEGRPATHDEAPAVAGRYYGDLDLLRGRLHAAYEWLVAQPSVDADRVVAAGYCFGGSGALELARTGADLRGTVAFHARLVTHAPSDAPEIRGSVLVLGGGDDAVVPDDAVHAFTDELRAAGVPWEVTLYGGAPHAYTIADQPSFRPEADRRAWVAFTDFLTHVLV